MRDLTLRNGESELKYERKQEGRGSVRCDGADPCTNRLIVIDLLVSLA